MSVYHLYIGAVRYMYVIARSVTQKAKPVYINSKSFKSLNNVQQFVFIYTEMNYKQRNKRRDKIAIEKRIKLCEQVKEKKHGKL